MTEEAQFLIIEEKYTLSIIKNNKKPKHGISIFKKTLELNQLNEDNIQILLKKTKKEDIIHSYANIGLISLVGLLCFAFCTEKDIKEIGIISLIKIYQIRNIRYIIIQPEMMEENTKKKIIKMFREYTKHEINKGLIFAQNLLNIDLCFDSFYHHLYDINKNICHINPKINFCYNYDHMTYFRRANLEEYATHLVSGYYSLDLIRKPQKDDLIIHLIIKDKEMTNEKDNNNIQNDKILRQIELILTSNNINFSQLLHFLFFSYTGDFLEDDKFLYNLLKDGHPDKKVDNGPVLIIDIQKQIIEKNDKEKNNFISELNYKLIKQFNNNIKIIYIKNNNEINNVISKNKDIIKEIRYNYEIKGKDCFIEFEKKQLLIISESELSSFNIIESVLNTIKYKMIDEYGKMIYSNEINKYIKERMAVYRNYIKKKNENCLKIENITSESVDEEYLKKKIGRKNTIIEMEKESNEKTKSDSDNLEIDFGNLQINDIQKENNLISFDDKVDILNINNIIEEKNDKNISNKKEKETGNKDNNIFTIYIVTNNVSNYSLENNKNVEETLQKLLFPKETKNYFTKKNYPTFYCVGLQEIVELNTSNVIFELNKNSSNLWESKITQLLQKNYNYTLQFRENLVGLLFLFFVKTSEAKNITDIKKSVIKAGFLNALGNKGYMLFEFKYKNKSFSFCSGHLTAGQHSKDFQNRFNLLIDILNHRSKNSNTFYKNNFYFLFGDMNFRVKLNKKIFFQTINEIQYLNKKVFDDSYISNKTNVIEDLFGPFINRNKKKERNSFSSAEKAMQYSDSDDDEEDYNDKKRNRNKNMENEFKGKKKLDEEQFKTLFYNQHLEKEELNELKPSLKQYGLDEHKIKFLPTYKYIQGYNYYNVSKRIPSWTDRILFKKNKEIQCLFYDRIDVRYSDHRPVYALFEVKINDIK